MHPLESRVGDPLLERGGWCGSPEVNGGVSEQNTPERKGEIGK